MTTATATFLFDEDSGEIQAVVDWELVYNLYWAVISLIGTAPRNADLQLTQLDVMYNFI